MKCNYSDILSRIPDKPSWFDECAVPRFVDFHPSRSSDIYARECALVEIGCQNCQTRFRVAFARSAVDDLKSHRLGMKPRTLADSIREKTIHYGDPPNVRCCPAGPTMNSDPLRVIEFWHKSRATDYEWERDTSLEIDVSGIESACA